MVDLVPTCFSNRLVGPLLKRMTMSHESISFCQYCSLSLPEFPTTAHSGSSSGPFPVGTMNSQPAFLYLEVFQHGLSSTALASNGSEMRRTGSVWLMLGEDALISPHVLKPIVVVPPQEMRAIFPSRGSVRMGSCLVFKSSQSFWYLGSSGVTSRLCGMSTFTGGSYDFGGGSARRVVFAAGGSSPASPSSLSSSSPSGSSITCSPAACWRSASACSAARLSGDGFNSPKADSLCATPPFTRASKPTRFPTPSVSLMLLYRR
mmetsp:Transcript_23597/g.60611  ORF Transcript_23597/g.60611 Transcript_23597/m.60611 type:complete len:262 (-) Transcript_23597:139-924(-)